MVYTKDVLRPGFVQKRREGFYAESGRDGQLRHFGFYRDGEPVGWVLDIDAKRMTATRTNVRPFGGEENEHEWAREMVNTIYREAGHRVCLFCGKTDAEVATLIAGPDQYSYICDECVNSCAKILEDKRAGG